MQTLFSAIQSHGDRAALIPAHHLGDIQKEMDRLKATGWMNGYQHYITDTLYRLDTQGAPFPVRSILLLASPTASYSPASFQMEGKTLHTRIAGTEGGDAYEDYLRQAFEDSNIRAQYEWGLPCKLLAAHSGLAQYGRNNITYIEGMGSFFYYAAYFTDLAPADDPWTDAITQHPACASCRACAHNCPTGAILPDRYLINNEKCISSINEGAGDVFPDWIPESAHNCVADCLKCQEICPLNREAIQRVGTPAAFDEDETQLLLKPSEYGDLPAALQQKIDRYNLRYYLAALPRNLRALSAQEGAGV